MRSLTHPPLDRFAHESCVFASVYGEVADHREYITYDSVIIQTCTELAVFCGFFLKSAGERHAQLQSAFSGREGWASSRSRLCAVDPGFLI